jgi:hypothetical protein
MAIVPSLHWDWQVGYENLNLVDYGQQSGEMPSDRLAMADPAAPASGLKQQSDDEETDPNG